MTCIRRVRAAVGTGPDREYYSREQEEIDWVGVADSLHELWLVRGQNRTFSRLGIPSLSFSCCCRPCPALAACLPATPWTRSLPDGSALQSRPASYRGKTNLSLLVFVCSSNINNWGMSRFTRFVALTSLALLVIYLLYPGTDLATISRANEPVVTPEKAVERQSAASAQATPSTAARTEQGPRGLREILAKEFPYDPESVFPSFIWQTWKSTPSESDFEFREPEASWTERHPGYIHEVGPDMNIVIVCLQSD